MPQRRGWRPLAAILAALLACAGPAAAQPATPGSIYANGARTYYEAIDLDTPEAAAQAFLAAWARRDYATANVVLSPMAQQGWLNQIARTFSFATLLPKQADAVMKVSAYGPNGADWAELMNDPNLVFDNIMRSAEGFGALPFTIGPAAKAGKPAGSGDAVTVTAETDGTPATLELQLARLPSGHWKVDRIVLPDADPALKPWGFKPK